MCYFYFLQKEDVENALRSSNMSLPDAMEMLGNWGRRSEEHSFEQSMLRGAGFNPVQPCYTVSQLSPFVSKLRPTVEFFF